MPVFIWGLEFEQIILDHLSATRAAVGPAPLASHQHSVPLRLQTWGRSADDAVAIGVPLESVKMLHDQMHVCLDTSFWTADPIWSKARQKGELLSADQVKTMKHSSKKVCRTCVDHALSQLRVLKAQCAESPTKK